MNAELLLAHFDGISDAPGAVPRLRRFVLDLAVRGKLVEQDLNDEPVPALLNRIRREKIKLIERGNVRKQKPLVPLDSGEIPFSVPVSWQWSQLAEVGFINPRNSAEDGGQASFVQMSSISAEYGVANAHEVRPWGDIKSGFTHFAEGDVALAKITPCFENGKSTVFRNLEGGIGAGTTELHVVRPVFVAADYILIFLKSPYFIESGIPIMTGTAGQKRVSTEYFAYSPFPLPPEEEQHRIVAKVDELMALCDRLGAAQREREIRRDQLAASTHHHLNNGVDAEALRSHAQFFIGHLPRLTARPDQVKQLRQTVLNLAVRGKLVPQDPSDEPASELMRRIEREAFRLIRDGAIKQQKVLPRVSSEEAPFCLPSKWLWVRLSAIVDVQDPNPSHRMPHYVNSGGVPFISSENFIEGDQINFGIGKRVTQQTLDEQIARFSILPKALAFTRIGTIGKSRFLPIERMYAISHAVCVLNPLNQSALSMEFLRSALGTEAILRFAHRGTRSIGVPDLGMAVIRKMVVPLPPLAEQHRIVAEVDELMALCDQLESHLTTAQTEAARLLESVLHHALKLPA